MDLAELLSGVDAVFDRLLARTRGRAPKRLKLQLVPELSLSGLYAASARSEGDEQADPEPLKTLLQVAEGYLEAERSAAKAALTRVAQEEDPEAVTRGLEDVRKRVVGRVQTILETEATVARNVGGLEAVGKVAAAFGIDDPIVYFVVVRDGHICEECVRLHLMEDRATPRLWRRSEVGAGYHKRGDQTPKVGGLHPNCRCSLVQLMPGYGFGADGRVRYVARGHDELSRQRA